MLALIKASNEGRVEGLVPIRHGRMLASPFTFYRGAPAVMAYDLAHTPSSGIHVQLCGDCHISNFGMFASPERALVFDLNDFDETFPGPFEWDVKRIAASIVVAARNAGLTKKDAKKAVQMTMRVYRMKINEFARRSYLDTWYSRIEADIFLEMVEKKHRKIASTQLARVRDKDRLAAFNKLTQVVGLQRRIIHNLPLFYRLDKTEEDILKAIKELLLHITSRWKTAASACSLAIVLLTWRTRWWVSGVSVCAVSYRSGSASTKAILFSCRSNKPAHPYSSPIWDAASMTTPGSV